VREARKGGKSNGPVELYCCIVAASINGPSQIKPNNFRPVSSRHYTPPKTTFKQKTQHEKD